jgi:tRNA(Arg) A34 adenosine deaminase TadA
MSARNEPGSEAIVTSLLRANDVARRSVAIGHHPFGALLLAPDHATVLIEQCNLSTVDHAESTLARCAAGNFAPDYLWQCTLVTTVEPCVMCSGTIYWANIGRVIYGLTEDRLRAFTGNHAENPTMALSARSVFEHGQKAIITIGPVPAVEAEIAELHHAFWPPA